MSDVFEKKLASTEAELIGGVSNDQSGYNTSIRILTECYGSDRKISQKFYLEFVHYLQMPLLKNRWGKITLEQERLAWASILLNLSQVFPSSPDLQQCGYMCGYFST